MASSTVSADGRYFEHGVDLTVLPRDVLLGALIEELKAMRLETLTHLEAASSWNAGVYTGDMGIALALFLLNNSDWEAVAHSIFAQLRGTSKSKRVTFLEGPMASIMLAQTPHTREQLLHSARQALALPSSECELLYGRAGCLHGLLFYARAFKGASEDVNDAIRSLAEEIVAEGKRAGRGDYLMWMWHNKEYLGAVHGVAGILFILLSVPRSVLLSIDENIYTLIQQTVDHCLTEFLYESGNIKSSTRSASGDHLVHFCHGATGWIPLLCAMSREYETDRNRYLREASRFGQVVWERGLIADKGPGICHGIAGSILALMDLYWETRETIWLQRGQQFAIFLASHWRYQSEKADNKYSLFEGIAGAFFAISVVFKVTDDPSFPRLYSSWFPGLGV